MEENQIIARYSGSDITCYPGSNQEDDGKLNLEYNMARLVTRVSSKNFCIVKPSFEISKINDQSSNKVKLQISIGQCSINGMDLIMTNTLKIDPPAKNGTYHLAFKLARDSSNNVLGDLKVGVTTRFEGVYLTYYSEKLEPQTDMDMLYLGQVTWDGNDFTNIIEDEDKYGRIWAEDVLGKFLDPKHPDTTRLNLQQFIYTLPDWYFSKEGDTVYGPIIIKDNRTDNNPGIIINADSNSSHIVIKDPQADNDKLQLYGDVNRDGIIDQKDLDLINQFINKTKVPNALQTILADVNHDGVIDQKDVIYISNFIKKKGNPADTGNIYFIDNTTHGLSFNSNENKSVSPDLKFDINFVDGNNIQQTLGKAIWQYNNTTQNISLLQNNVKYLDIVPNGIYRQNLRVITSLYLGSNDSLPQTTLSRTEWWLRQNVESNGNTINFTPDRIIMTNPTLTDKDNSYILLRNTQDTIHTKIFDDAKIELLNPTRASSIVWKDGNVAFDIILSKVINQKKLNLDGDFNLVNLTASGSVTGNGLITSNGILTFKRGTNDATITKDNNGSSLRTNGPLYVGASGTQPLYSGNTVVNGTFGVGGSTYANSELKVDSSGNLNTSGTITGSKVYNSVYNDFGEIFRKNKNEIIEYGDIIYIGQDGLAHTLKSLDYIDSVIGICSDTIGVRLGGKDIPKEEQVEVGLLGKIWVKTDEQYLQKGQMVKINENGKVVFTNNPKNKFGITLSDVKDGKVEILYK